MAKVLFVDDEPDIELLAKQKFRKQIASGAFELLFASNGQKALDIIEKEPLIAVVVSDVNMPEMDGLTLLDKLKKVSPATKTIVVSAYGDTKTLRAAMNNGAFDFVTKPVDFKELEETILRTLALYELPSSPLYTYQRLLTIDFPEKIDLNYSHTEGTVLWDAFRSDGNTITIIGVSILPSSIPMDLGISAAHGLLKLALQENIDLPVFAFQEKLVKINAGLKAHVIIGRYHLESHGFSYRTTGDFKVQLISSAGESSLNPSDMALLSLGDIVTITHPPSTSHLSLPCLQ